MAFMVAGMLLLVWGMFRLIFPVPEPVPWVPRKPIAVEVEADLLRPVTEWIAEAEAEAVREYERETIAGPDGT